MNTMISKRCAAALAALLGPFALTLPAHSQTTNLADQPIFVAAVPGNLALDLSVEYPTAISVANIGDYADASTYLGYFDPGKCYTYTYNSTTPASSYFQPASFATGTNSHQCSGQWSGNFMNWASMQTIDPFRSVLTGGYRSVDTTSMTILEKAWGSQQGSASSNFNYRGTSQLTGNNLPATLISKVTPFSNWSVLNTGVWGNGNTMLIAQGTGYTASTFQSNVYDLPGDVNSAAPTPGALFTSAIPNTVFNVVTYRAYIRVKVCDPTTSMGVAGLESNCVKYGSIYKPQGLMQTYAGTIRYSAFGYLNSSGLYQQGGVLREPMGYISPTYPVPLSASLVTNTRPEWDPTTGIMSVNPDTATASASGVSQSGVMNYLNKFGEYAAAAGNNSNTYMTNDNVSELYYASLRYFENLGNVPQWDSSPTATQLDGFPAVITWTDPILYSCQKNFILGIGDDHTWTDYSVGGSGFLGVSNSAAARPAPALVSSDSLNKAATWTTEMQTLEGLSTANPFLPFGATASTYYISGLAYGAHVIDIRADLTGTQTVSTFWMDVEEGGGPENLNQYYEAAKYGGFTVPSGYSLTNTTPLPLSEWDTSGNSITMNYGISHYQPDNYYLAGNANLMAAGLTKAFASISSAVAAYGTAFSLPKANLSASGTLSFSSQYNPNNWTDTIIGNTLTFDSSGNPSNSTQLWVSSMTLQNQLAGTGWQTARNVATWNGSSGVPFEIANLTASQVAALVPSSYSSSTSSTQYLNYLRGDQSNEVGSTATGSTKSLRARTLLLGDVVDASLTEVAAPSQAFSEANNPGYTAFTTQWTTTTPRPTMVYAAANDGMLHGFVGTSGLEQFAYVPSGVFQGPTSTPQVNGLAALGNPTFAHHYYVDATPINYDIDLNRTGGNTSGSPNWRTLLIGGLAKGGKSYYAIDVTDPASMSSESAVAGRVKWEFTDSTMGYSFGAPIAVKTAQYGWVVAFTSGYNSSSTYGWLYLVNPSTGALLQKIATPSASNGLTQATAYVQDYTDYTSDSIYVGDLNGQLWRFDLTTATGSYPAPTLLATLTDASGNAQPVTTAPLIEIHPTTRKRYVMVGTGQFLSASDVTSTSQQSFYVIVDGTAGSFSAVSTPITRANLTAVTSASLVTGATFTPTTKGYYIDLGTDPSSGIAWRVNINPKAYASGVVAFAALLPSGNACNLSGQGETYTFNYATATSVLISAPLGYYATSSAVVNLNFVGLAGTNGSNAELIAGLASGAILQIPTNLSNTLATRILNWRELPSAE